MKQLVQQTLINLYDSKTSTQLANDYNVTRGQITKIWYDNNLIGKLRNKYPFNYNYFESINTNDKAYFLGLLASDGNVHSRKNKKKHQSIIRLSLKSEDEKILEIFKLYLNSEQPLYTTEKENSSYITYMKTLELVSEKMAEDLRKYNITERKTYDYKMVDLGNHLMSHFFRGYFDGDGSITCIKNKLHSPSYYNISISGFVSNLKVMKTYLEKNENIYSEIVFDKRNNKNFGYLTFNNIKQMYMFVKYIYENRGDIFLARKRYLAECFINAIQKNYSNKKKIYDIILNETNM